MVMLSYLNWSNKTRRTIDRSVVDDDVRFMVCVLLETFLKSDDFVQKLLSMISPKILYSIGSTIPGLGSF